MVKVKAWKVELEMELDKFYARSPAAGLKVARMILALMAIITFAIDITYQAYLALVITELVVTFLFYLLYLLALHKNEKIKSFLWPLADALDSLVAALFLLIGGIIATAVETNTATLVGGVFCLLNCILCIIDAALILKKIKVN